MLFFVNFVQLVVVFSLFYTFTDAKIDWGYFGRINENYWPGLCQTGKNQSPINIDDRDLYYDKIGAIKFSGFDGGVKEYKMTSDGHTVKISFPSIDASITGNILNKEKFNLTAFHFHWGSRNSMGSEHTVNSERFALEKHDVYKHPTEDRYAVVSTLYRVDQDYNGNNEVLRQILDTIDTKMTRNRISVTGNFNFTGASMHNFMLLDDKNEMSEYCSYTGSFTTPPCTEGVTWLVQNLIQHIPAHYVEKLRGLPNKSDNCNGSNCINKLVNNFRSTKPLNGRKVMCNVKIM